MGEAYVTRDELLAQVATLTAEVAQLRQVNAQLQEQVTTLTARLADLERRDPPAGIKANRPKPTGERPPRKRRRFNSARRRETPTETITHASDTCPDCGTALRGGAVVSRRQIIDVPLPPATVTEHVVLARYCPGCQQTVTPSVDLSDTVLGQHRVSLQLMALITLLREQVRLPLGLLRRYLREVHQVHLSHGELVAILKTVAARGASAAQAIRNAIRQSPVVHADETSWRQDGQHGYLWSLSTPTLRYFARGKRDKDMVDALLGDKFDGVLVTDFYAAYDHYPGPHQRCWTHLLRDIHELRRKFPSDAGLARWARAVRRLYDAAKADPGPPAALAAGEQVAWRRQRQRRYENALARLCRRSVDQAVPQRVLCARILKYLPELFTFVYDPRVPADNNAAERSIRPVAVRRKISGGTRSASGTQVRTILWSLLATWQAQGQDLLDACVKMLRTPAIAPV